MKMKKSVKYGLVICGVLGLLLIAGRIFLHVAATSYANSVTLHDDAFSRSLKVTPDGVYTASNDHNGFMKVVLKVTVKEHRLSAVDFVSHETGRKRSEKIVKKVLEKQSLKVDAISGATASSKMILTTIEKAIVGKK